MTHTELANKVGAKRYISVDLNNLMLMDKLVFWDNILEERYESYPRYMSAGKSSSLAGLLLDEYQHDSIIIKAVNTKGYAHMCTMQIPKSNIEEFCTKLMSLR